MAARPPSVRAYRLRAHRTALSAPLIDDEQWEEAEEILARPSDVQLELTSADDPDFNQADLRLVRIP